MIHAAGGAQVAWRPWLALAAAVAAMPLLAQQEERYDRDGATIYLERITPPGPVEPMQIPSRRDDLPGEQGYLGDPSWHNRPSRDRDAAPRLDEQNVLDAFGAKYRAAGSPRIAVYFNRELSEEVREWIPRGRVVENTSFSRGSGVSARYDGVAEVTGTKDGERDGRLQLAEEFSAGGHTRGSAQRSAIAQDYIAPTGGRDDPREGWKWEFEDGVASTFLGARTRIVDRAMILRLMAKRAPQSAGLGGTVSTTRNETSALTTYADILVEVLVTRSSGSYTGYDFRATAKDVKTGMLLATAFVRGDENPNPIEKTYAAGSSGYQRVEIQELPSVADVSRHLSLKLMDSMKGNL